MQRPRRQKQSSHGECRPSLAKHNLLAQCDLPARIPLATRCQLPALLLLCTPVCYSYRLCSLWLLFFPKASQSALCCVTGAATPSNRLLPCLHSHPPQTLCSSFLPPRSPSPPSASSRACTTAHQTATPGDPTPSGASTRSITSSSSGPRSHFNQTPRKSTTCGKCSTCRM